MNDGSFYFYTHPNFKEVEMCYCHRRRYGFFAFLLDLFLVFITGGLWLIWIFCREMRNRCRG